MRSHCFAENGDDFQTPMSTPPSEAEEAGAGKEGEGQGKTDTGDLANLSLSEAQLYDRLYERWEVIYKEMCSKDFIEWQMKDTWLCTVC